MPELELTLVQAEIDALHDGVQQARVILADLVQFVVGRAPLFAHPKRIQDHVTALDPV